MEHTEHFNLNQPQPSDKVDIEKISENFGTIDQPLYNGQTVHEVVESLMSPEGDRPNLYPGDVYAENIEAEQDVTFRTGSSAKFEGVSNIDIGQNVAVVDHRAATADAGSIMVRDTNDHVRPSDTDLEDIKKTMDGDFKQKTVETTALKVLSGASPIAGDVLVRTSENYVQASDVTLEDITPKDAVLIHTGVIAGATPIPQGTPIFDTLTVPRNLTANTYNYECYLGVIYNSPEEGEEYIVCVSGYCKIRVTKTSTAYSDSLGLTVGAFSAYQGGRWITRGNASARKYSDARDQLAFIVNPDDVTAYASEDWTEGTTRLVDAYICH